MTTDLAKMSPEDFSDLRYEISSKGALDSFEALAQTILRNLFRSNMSRAAAYRLLCEACDLYDEDMATALELYRMEQFVL